MKYNNIIKGRFIKRLNRFVALCEIEGEEVCCHVKNTGRCGEILVPDAECYLEKSDNPNRKYTYSLVVVRKGERLINIDSQAPNKAAAEFLSGGGIGIELYNLKAEKTFGKSRFDFYFEHNGKEAFLEVKGVTLENDGVVSFPDAPTERGTKHLNELSDCVKKGYEAYVLFVVQMKGVSHFSPNSITDPDFAEALKRAQESGVHIFAYDCFVSETEMIIKDSVPVIL